MSTSLKVVSIAAVLCASTSRLAIVARRFDMRTRSSVRSPSARRRSSRDRRRGLRLRLARRGGAAGAGGRRRGAAAARGRLLDVALHDAAGVAAAAHAGEIDVVRCAALRAVGVARGFAAVAAAASAGRRFGRRLPRLGAAVGGGGAGCAAADASSITPSTSPTFTSVAVLCVDLAQHAGLRRADLEVDLVGLELDERLAGGDGVAFLLQPLRDARVDDRLADFGHDDV